MRNSACGFGVRGHVRALVRRDMSRRGKRQHVAALQKAMSCHRTPYQKSSGTARRSVLKLFTVATSAGDALRANHDAEHHL